MRERIKSGIVIAILFILLAVFSKYNLILRIILMLLSILSMLEILNVTKMSKNIYVLAWCTITSVCIPLFIQKCTSRTDTIVLFASSAVLLTTAGILLLHKQKKRHTIYLIIILSLLIPFFYSTIALVRDMRFGAYLFYSIFLCSWGTDTSGFFFGYYFGKRKMSPHISPKKTFEGAIGGIITSVGVFAIIGYCAHIFRGAYVNYAITSIIGVFCCIVSICGDLSASFVKRCYGAKDYGKVIPGHGGIMDRFDSVLYVAPMIYFAACILKYFNTFIIG